jgi:hypothetical protein
MATGGDIKSASEVGVSAGILSQMSDSGRTVALYWREVRILILLTWVQLI